MPHPTLTTTWPDGDDLAAWLGATAVDPGADDDLLDEVLDDAAAIVYAKIDPNKLPEDDDLCPRAVSRAIVLEAARLWYRKQSPHGVAAFADVAVRLRTVDADVEELLRSFGLDPEP
jgi:hypothetical protein